MIPMIDSAVPGLTSTLVTIDPTTIGVLVALVGAVAWLVSGAARELRHEPAAVRFHALARLAA